MQTKKFHYKAREKKTGKLVAATIEAPTEQEAIKKLRSKDLLILSMDARGGGQFSWPVLNRVKSGDRILFTRELAVMIRAGLPILQALKAIEEQTSNPNLKKAISGLIGEVEGGGPLSIAFSHYPAIFPPIFASVTKSGEKSGKLEEVLERLATQLEKDNDLVAKVRSAMVYPTFVLIALVSVIILIMVYIIPQLKSLFDDASITLPLITRALLATSDFFTKYIILILVIGVVLAIGVRLASRKPKPRLFLERIRFFMPIFGSLYRKVLMTRFTHTLSTLLAAGLPVTESLATTADVMDSPTFHQSIDELISKVKNGQNLSSSLLADKQFSPMIGHMVTIGENSGKTDSVLETVAGFFDKEVENLTRNLSSLLEPFLMLLMGLGVGLVVASVIIPIYNLVNAV